MATNILELVEHVQRQGELGKAEGQRSRLAQLASRAFAAPLTERRGLLAQMASVDPSAVTGIRNTLSDMDSDSTANLARRAGMIVSMADAGNEQVAAKMYPQLAADARALGLGDGIPDQWDVSFLPGLRHLSQSANHRGGMTAGQRDFSSLTSGLEPAEVEEARRIRLGLSPRAGLPETRGIRNESGGYDYYGIDRKNRSAHPIYLGEGTQVDPPQPSGGPYQFGSGANAVNIDLSGEPGLSAGDQQRIAAEMSQMLANGRSDDEVDEWLRNQLSETRDLSPEQWHGRPQPQQLSGAPTPQKVDREDFGQPVTVTDPKTGQPILAQIGSNGTVRPVSGVLPGPTARDARPPTEGQLAGAGFLQRMTAAEDELNALRNAGYKPESNLRDYATAGEGPLLNWAASSRGQHNRQQQEDWVRAKLRKESGAVIGADEMDREIKTYFPQPGDSKDVIDSKARSRQRAIEQMRITAGRAAEEMTPSGGAAAQQAPPTRARNPQTGDVLELRNGKWERVE